MEPGLSGATSVDFVTTQSPQQQYDHRRNRMTQPQKNLTDYLAVATEWHRRGFFTTPVKPMAKHPRLNEYNKKPAKNLSVAMQHAFDYPHDDVGLVSTRGAGHFFWLDIDHQSVEDRIFRATGRRLPKT